MQHSLILAFVSLGDNNYEINIQTIIDFFNYLYSCQIEYVDAVTELCLKINDDGNCSVVLLTLFSTSWNSSVSDVFFRKILTSNRQLLTQYPSGFTSDKSSNASFLPVSASTKKSLSSD